MRDQGANRLARWLFQGYTARPVDLAIYRILYASYMLLTYVPTGAWLGSIPRTFFNPPYGLAAFFTGYPHPSAIAGLNVLLACFLAMLFVGWRTPFASLGTALTLVLLNSWAYTLGKIDHDILVVLVPLVMSFSGWGSMLSLDARRNPISAAQVETWPLSILALLIGFGMFTAGWAKISSGWLDTSTRSCFGHLLQNYLNTGRHTVLADWLIPLNSVWIWEGADWTVTVLELAFLPAIFRRRSMFDLMALASIFHVGVWLLFDIAFSANVIAYAVYVPYTDLRLFSRVREHAQGRPYAFRATFTGLLLLALGAITLGEPLAAVIGLPIHPLVVVIGGVFGAGYLANRISAMVARLMFVRDELPAMPLEAK